MTPQAGLDHVGAELRRKFYRQLPDDRLDDGAVGMYADRFRWGPFGTAIAHAAMVVILAAFGISGNMKQGLGALLLSHPPLDERIQALRNATPDRAAIRQGGVA